MKCSIYLLQSAELKQEFYTAGNQRQTVDIITDNMDVD